MFRTSEILFGKRGDGVGTLLTGAAMGGVVLHQFLGLPKSLFWKCGDGFGRLLIVGQMGGVVRHQFLDLPNSLF